MHIIKKPPVCGQVPPRPSRPGSPGGPGGGGGRPLALN